MEESTDSISGNKFLRNGKSVEVSDVDEDSNKECTSGLDVRICLVGALASDQHVLDAAQNFQVPVVTSTDGSEWELTTPLTTVFVLEEFSGHIYEKLHSMGHRILGPTALRELAEKGQPLPNNTRPLYTISMKGAVICFTRFRKKEEVARLVTLVHHMGGSVKKEMSHMTHLVANTCGGERYQYAMTFRVPVMASSWIHNAWAMRPEVGFSAVEPQMMSEHKLKIFQGARVCFLGFSEDEHRHVVNVLLENGGVLTDQEDPLCTHLVCDDRAVLSRDQLFSPKSPLPDPGGESLPGGGGAVVAGLRMRRSTLIDEEIDVLKYRRNDKSIDKELKIKDVDVKEAEKTYLKPLKDEDVENDEWMPSPLIRRCTNAKFSTPLRPDLVSSPSVFEDKKKGTSFKVEEEEEYDNFSTIPQLDKTDGDVDDIDDNDDSMSLCRFRRTTTVVEEKLCYRKKTPQKTPHERNDSFLREEFDYLTSICPYPKELLEKRSRLSICLPGELSLPLDSREVMGKSRKEEDTRMVSPLPRKRRKTLSPKKTPKKSQNPSENAPGGFKTPVLSSIRRSLRLKSVNSQLARWFSNADIGPTGCPSVAAQSSLNPPPPPPPQHPYRPPAAPPQSPGCASSPARHMKKEEERCLMPMVLADRRMLSVVDESSVSSTPSQVPPTAVVVKAEWFWASVQNEGCVDEKEHLFEDYLESLVSPTRSTAGVNTPVSVTRTRKRKRLQEVVSRMVHPGMGLDNKRRSSISDAGLSCTPSPTQPLQMQDETESLASDLQRTKHLSPRHQVFLELVQTESNYVGILSTIETLFKAQLEKMVGTSDELLNPTEMKIIFGHLTPIYLTHRRMLEQLRHAAKNWTEDMSIGNIILKFAPDLLKTYPPFVNFFENTREMLMKCDATRQRFHAFLKVCQMKPECGRQSLQELLIRPIQRLASVMLLLNDILKHTPKSNDDHAALESALVMIREVMTHINEDKRRTEGQLAMFDIFNDIDNCPPHLVSSHRSYIARCELNELSDCLSGRGDSLVFFLFSDILEICKKRSKAFSNSLKSPNTAGGTAKLGGKPYKHIRLMPLSTIKRVFDVKETEECHKMFALMCKANQDLKEKIYSFVITSEDTEKMAFLKQLCRQMANTVCRADAENFLASLDPAQLDIDTSEVGLGTLGKAFKFASRTRMRVGRAFSFNKTPSKLKRAVSSVMSPFGSSSNLTPASQMAQMRLVSCNNLNAQNDTTGPLAEVDIEMDS